MENETTPESLKAQGFSDVAIADWQKRMDQFAGGDINTFNKLRGAAKMKELQSPERLAEATRGRNQARELQQRAAFDVPTRTLPSTPLTVPSTASATPPTTAASSTAGVPSAQLTSWDPAARFRLPKNATPEQKAEWERKVQEFKRTRNLEQFGPSPLPSAQVPLRGFRRRSPTIAEPWQKTSQSLQLPLLPEPLQPSLSSRILPLLLGAAIGRPLLLGGGIGAAAGGITGANRGNAAEGIGRGLVRGGSTGLGASLGATLGGLGGAAMSNDPRAAILGILLGGGLGAGTGWLGSGKLLGPSKTQKKKQVLAAHSSYKSVKTQKRAVQALSPTLSLSQSIAPVLLDPTVRRNMLENAKRVDKAILPTVGGIIGTAITDPYAPLRTLHPILGTPAETALRTLHPILGTAAETAAKALPIESNIPGAEIRSAFCDIYKRNAVSGISDIGRSLGVPLQPTQGGGIGIQQGKGLGETLRDWEQAERYGGEPFQTNIEQQQQQEKSLLQKGWPAALAPYQNAQEMAGDAWHAAQVAALLSPGAGLVSPGAAANAARPAAAGGIRQYAMGLPSAGLVSPGAAANAARPAAAGGIRQYAMGLPKGIGSGLAFLAAFVGVGEAISVGKQIMNYRGIEGAPIPVDQLTAGERARRAAIISEGMPFANRLDPQHYINTRFRSGTAFIDEDLPGHIQIEAREALQKDPMFRTTACMITKNRTINIDGLANSYADSVLRSSLDPTSFYMPEVLGGMDPSGQKDSYMRFMTQLAPIVHGMHNMPQEKKDAITKIAIKEFLGMISPDDPNIDSIAEQYGRERALSDFSGMFGESSSSVLNNINGIRAKLLSEELAVQNNKWLSAQDPNIKTLVMRRAEELTPQSVIQKIQEAAKSGTPLQPETEDAAKNVWIAAVGIVRDAMSSRSPNQP